MDTPLYTSPWKSIDQLDYKMNPPTTSRTQLQFMQLPSYDTSDFARYNIPEHSSFSYKPSINITDHE